MNRPSARDNLESQSLPLEHGVNINWVVPESINTLHATNLVLQQRGTEFHLLFFEICPPIIIGSPEEQIRAYHNMVSMDARCVARIVVSLENLQDMLNILFGGLSSIQQQISQLTNNPVEKEDDTNKTI